MSKVMLDLQEGFTNEKVVIRLNRAVVFTSAAVTTKLLLGYAEQISIPSPRKASVLEISLPNHQIKYQIPVKANEDTYIGVSFVDGRLIHFLSAKPFGYG